MKLMARFGREFRLVLCSTSVCEVFASSQNIGEGSAATRYTNKGKNAGISRHDAITAAQGVGPTWHTHTNLPLPCSFFVRFVLSSYRFPFVSCIAFFAFIFASLLSSRLGGGFCILLFRLGATPPPRSLRPCSMRIPLACCLLSCVLDVDLFLLFLLFLPFFDFDLDIVFSPCLFFAGTMLSLRFRFLLRLV